MSKGSTQDVGREDAKRSRRELIAGALAGTAGVIGGMALTRPTTAYAASYVVLGGSNTTPTATTITGGGGGDCFSATATGNGKGVVALTDNGSAVWGVSSSGQGVSGLSITGEGLYARSGSVDSSQSPSRNGIHGVTDSSADSAVWGENLGSPSGGNGVYGSTNSSGASGVYGHNAGTGFGVAGRAEGGTGVLGDSTNGTGVVANAATTNATALAVNGAAKFSRSGIVSIAAGKLSATVTYVVPNVAGGSFAIFLNKAVPAGKTAKVAWFVVN